MNTHGVMAVILGLTISATSTWAAQAPKGENQGVKPADAQVAVDPAAVAKLLTAVDNRDPAAEQELTAMVKKAAGTPAQHDIVMSLIAGLSEKHPVETRRLICGLLAQVAGESDAVAALNKAIDDPAITDAARGALVRIPDLSASRALLARLDQGDEAAKIATIAALGQKADASTVPALVERTTSTSDAIRKASWRALAQIPDAKAVQAFTVAVEEKKDALATAQVLDFVDVLLRAGMPGEADKLIKLRREAGPLDTADKAKVIRAHGRIGTPESISLVLNSLKDEDTALRQAALDAAAVLPSTDFTGELTQRMNAATGQEKLDLLEVLGKRGRQFDDRTVMLMYMAMLDKDDTVKIACIRAMKNAGITATSPTLINMVRGQTGPVADAAEDALLNLPGKSITQQIADAVAPSKGPAKLRLLKILEKRGDDAAIPAVLTAAGDTDVNVRAAAFETLGVLSGENAYDTILAAFGQGPGPDRDAAERAMMKLSGDTITAKLLSGYFEASDEAKPSILRVLAPRQLGAIDALLQSESVSSNERISEAAKAGIALRAKAAQKPKAE